ncbi:hypothetical protein [Haloplasma contractile]|uniref:Uncharacterized protein n=1 Tax=Haloplasma contractile SSD-17B TaxID=1033810 RepID=F7PUV5_9MOLU|nr:hypothetical protein [Haloplasma contractile]ERJ11046.1 hypothetical protein HLPCO_002937 [Haloplasma contractile SSD-17B]
MKLETLKKHKPTEEWKERMNGLEDAFLDEIFTEENIHETEKILDHFINSLIKLGEDPKQDDIKKSVNDVLKQLEITNERYGSFIDSMESEELLNFIELAASIAGLDYDQETVDEWAEQI